MEARKRMVVRACSIAALPVLLVAGCGDDEPDVVEAAPPVLDEPIAFETLDSNGDSYLDVDEIAETADGSGWFDRWDVDADSELDRDEIAGNAFSLWDMNGDGAITEDEWSEGTDLWLPRDAPVVFDDVDGDGDSELDADEFKERFDLSALGESWTLESVDEEQFRTLYFELYDFDDDGEVSELEWESGAAMFGTAAE